MIKKLQWKFVIITMAILIIMFGIIFITLNAFMQYNSIKQTDSFLGMVANQDGTVFLHKNQDSFDPNKPQNEGKFGGGDKSQSPPKDSRTMKAGRFFYVKVNEKNQLLEADYGMMIDFSQEDVIKYADTAMEKNKERGSIDDYQYLIMDKDYGKIVVFAERSVEIRMLSQLIGVSLVVFLASSVVLFVISIFFSRWAIRPVRDAFDRQRVFISDASHELKTPLTIIAANADVLEKETGASVRIDHIKAQSIRMSGLINELLALAKTDEGTSVVEMTEFNLSEAVLGTVLEFESRAFEENKKLDYSIEDGIRLLGNENQIKQVVATLVDNAIKYSDNAGEIGIQLLKKKNKIQLLVSNSGTEIDEVEKEKIFDRFYRSDQSRSRETGGYGLGLAIAKAIVENHRGKITVSSEAEKGTVFSIKF